MKTRSTLTNLVVISFTIIHSLASANFSAAQQKLRGTKILDYCSIVKAPERYIGRVIRTKALMTYSTVSRVDGADSFLYSSLCNNGDYFVATNYEEEDSNKSDKTDAFLMRLADEKNFIFEVVIKGQFDYSIVPTFGHLGWSLNGLKVHKIVSIRDVTQKRGYKKPNSKAERPRTDAGSRLQGLTRETLLYFLGSKSVEVEKSFDDGLEIFDTLSRTYGRSEIDKFRNAGLFESTLKYKDKFVSGPSVSYKSGSYIASGSLGATFTSGDKKTLQYECIYRLLNNEFILEKIRFSNKK